MSQDNPIISTPTYSKRAILLLWISALLLLVIGFGVRMYDLTDQPLDFHPTRQLRSAIIARGMYYQMMPDANPSTRRDAILFWHSTGQYEPSILERIVAYTYLVTGEENLWIARVYTSLFWIIGGLALFDLARRMALSAYKHNRPEGSSASKVGYLIGVAALVALGYYLFLPFGVQASRSFQPDPGMVMCIILSVYGLYRWSETKAWKWALFAGLLGGIAVLLKVVAAYIVAGAAVGMVLYSLGLKRFWRSLQVWSMAILMITPSAIYYLVDNQGRAASYFTSWTVELSHLLLEPSFYVRWVSFVQNLMGLMVILLALVGVLIASPRNRALLLGLWSGYIIYGLFLPYQMYTHSYYHEQLIPILALSLVPVAQAVLERLEQQTKIWQILFIGVALAGIAYPAWVSISTQKAENDRKEPAYWQEIASYLPDDGKILALTQDYGYRLMYYGWRKVILWPNRGELALSALRGSGKEFDSYFQKKIEDKSYFLVTAFGQFKDQPELQKTLDDHYPVYAKGDGYIIYDLQNPIAAAP
jgi:4-amino-4-deoxy-L-arabinose transferase-like glycosyltransferase